MHRFCIIGLRGRRGGGGRRVAGEAAWVHAGTRAGSVCETAGKPGRGAWVVGFGGLEVTGGSELCAAVLFGPCGCFAFAESDRIWQRSLFLSALTFPNP